MSFSRKAAFVPFTFALLLLAMFFSQLEARADAIVITSGEVFIGGPTSPSRGAWRTLSFNFAGNDFGARGGVGDGNRQGISSPCSFDPCQPGTIAFPKSGVTLDGLGLATVNGTQTPAWWFGQDSYLAFNGPGVVIPDSTIAELTLTSTFTMTGTVLVHSLNTPGLPIIFSTDVIGSGIATLSFRYVTLFGPPGYVLTGVRYQFTPVPEPATLFLLGTGLAGLAARRRRRHAHK